MYVFSAHTKDKDRQGQNNNQTSDFQGQLEYYDCLTEVTNIETYTIKLVTPIERAYKINTGLKRMDGTRQAEEFMVCWESDKFKDKE